MFTDAGDVYGAVMRQVRRADLFGRRVADEELNRVIGVGRAMFSMLDMLADARRPLSQQEIANHLGLTRAAIGRQVKYARTVGWVSCEPSKTSLRENAVRISAAGSKLVRHGRRHREIAARRAAEALDLEQLRHVAETLNELCAYLEERLRELSDV